MLLVPPFPDGSSELARSGEAAIAGVGSTEWGTATVNAAGPPPPVPEEVVVAAGLVLAGEVEDEGGGS